MDRRFWSWQRLWVLVLTALLIGAAAPALAHHSFAMFDREHPAPLSGTVKEFQWTNPHVWIQVLAKDSDGKPAEWGVELTSVNSLKRQGWTRSSLKAGDRVKLTIFPLRDGSHGGQLNKVDEINGQPSTLPGYR